MPKADVYFIVDASATGPTKSFLTLGSYKSDDEPYMDLGDPAVFDEAIWKIKKVPGHSSYYITSTNTGESLKMKKKGGTAVLSIRKKSKNHDSYRWDFKCVLRLVFFCALLKFSRFWPARRLRLLIPTKSPMRAREST